MRVRASAVLTSLKKRLRRHKEPVPPVILFVDDDELVRSYVSRVLRQAGYRTAIAKDAADAMRVASADGPFNLLRIVRNGQTIDIDGLDPNTPRCQPTGFIQPGDHVYLDGRNDFGPGPVNPNGYTTASVVIEGAVMKAPPATI